MFLKNWYKIVFGMMAGKDLPVSIKDVNGTVRDLGFYNSNTSIYSVVHDIMKQWAKSMTTTGVVFGDGNAPVTMDDYTLSGQVVSTCNVSITNTSSGDENGITVEKVFTVTNSGSEEITIREAGILVYFYYGSGASKSKYALVERTVLDYPVTLAPGEVGQVIYRISAPFPTA